MAGHPVCCITEVPIAVLNRLLNEAFAGSEELVPDSEHQLAIAVNASDGSSKLQEKASVPPLNGSFTPFVAASIDDAARHIGDVSYFAVLDRQSIDDSTALLLHRQKDGSNSTARVTFKSVQHILVSLSVAALGFQEIQDIAESQGGIYGRDENRPKRGGLTPPKKLGLA
ncbi:hypothetical protein F5Y03DRAFT_401624 [Xylaria venustula]|nr:hypothetical protein F5Y03DRAFT_401624 [Xylaria venustula]